MLTYCTQALTLRHSIQNLACNSHTCHKVGGATNISLHLKWNNYCKERCKFIIRYVHTILTPWKLTVTIRIWKWHFTGDLHHNHCHHRALPLDLAKQVITCCNEFLGRATIYCDIHNFKVGMLAQCVSNTLAFSGSAWQNLLLKDQISKDTKLPTRIFRQWDVPAELPEDLSVKQVLTSSELQQQSQPCTEAIPNNFWQCAMTSLPGQM